MGGRFSQPQWILAIGVSASQKIFGGFLPLANTSRFSKSRSPVDPQHFQMPFGINKISQDRQRDIDVPRFSPSLPSVVRLCQPLLERLCSPAGGF